ncbi:unnamed protein product [Pseudo-nitzschia multistriata]|uniref:EF-hand domain-containing protein n=1 Tax=Pseudo-nitzschia multistriata TaxID=183589 RepID=A0A448ZQ19_9STRA|nr:unnamed protein product [Pseudo-nitzschia multistriata]
MRGLCLAIAVVAAPATTRAWTLSSSHPLRSYSHKYGSHSYSYSQLFLSAEETETSEIDGRDKMATDLRRLFDIDEMAYTVMIPEEHKGPDGKLTPEQLVDAIKKDGMFGEEFEEYCTTFSDSDENEGVVRVLDIGKFSDDFESSAPLPEDCNLTIQGKGNYLVHISLTDEIFATMRVVVA